MSLTNASKNPRAITGSENSLVMISSSALHLLKLTYRESLRDIETCLNSHHEKLYHIGFRGQISRSTLADASEERDYRIYQDFAYHLISIARRLYQNEELAVELDYSLYAFDSTTIDLCLSLFPWAHFRKTKAAIKMHTLLDLRGSIPTFISLTTGKVHDVNMLDMLPLQKDAVITQKQLPIFTNNDGRWVCPDKDA